MSSDSSAELWVGLGESDMPQMFLDKLKDLDDDLFDTCKYFGVDYNIVWDGYYDEQIIGYRVFEVEWGWDEVPTPDTYADKVHQFEGVFGIKPKLLISSCYF